MAGRGNFLGVAVFINKQEVNNDEINNIGGDDQLRHLPLDTFYLFIFFKFCLFLAIFFSVKKLLVHNSKAWPGNIRNYLQKQNKKGSTLAVTIFAFQSK